MAGVPRGVATNANGVVNGMGTGDTPLLRVAAACATGVVGAEADVFTVQAATTGGDGAGALETGIGTHAANEGDTLRDRAADGGIAIARSVDCFGPVPEELSMGNMCPCRVRSGCGDGAREDGRLGGRGGNADARGGTGRGPWSWPWPVVAGCRCGWEAASLGMG